MCQVQVHLPYGSISHHERLHFNIDHGVGRYMGLERIAAGGDVAEYLTLVYQNDANTAPFYELIANAVEQSLKAHLALV